MDFSSLKWNAALDCWANGAGPRTYQAEHLETLISLDEKVVSDETAFVLLLYGRCDLTSTLKKHGWQASAEFKRQVSEFYDQGEMDEHEHCSRYWLQTN